MAISPAGATCPSPTSTNCACAYQQAQENVELAKQAIKSAAKAALDGNPDIAVDDHPAVRAALTNLDNARLNLERTTIKAPADGIVSQIEKLNVGQYAAAGSPMLTLVETGNVWIEANLKETQLTSVKPGQPADIAIDAYPDSKIQGSVASIGAGTGSEFSLIPAQNATGNWVKVVQRLPVRLKVDRRIRPAAAHRHERVRVDRHRQDAAGYPAEVSVEAASSSPAEEVAHRGPLTVAIMLATIMQVIDTTIANVALPHMQASLNATQDTITWVLTSYIVAAAIMTPVTGWLSDNLGRKRFFPIAVIGFTIMSLLCGLATNLPEMVFFRLAQGVFGAALAPMSQAVILDINPRERHGQAMAIWGAGIMVGPIIGPTLGGWLTETFEWRYVFYVNLPVGILALAGIMAFMPGSEPKQRRFDLFGFAMLTLALGSLQMMLDRGQGQDWFASPEIWMELGLAITGVWVFVIHSLTHGEPFIDMAIFKDRNFTMGLVFIFIIGMILLAGLALMPPLLQNLKGYPVVTTGVVLAPRGAGTMVSMLLVGRLVRIVDARILVLTGLALTAWSLDMMAGFTIGMGMGPLISSGIVQGLGFGLVFVPLTTLAYATLAAKYRTDGTALFNLVRNIGSSIGISIVTAALIRLSQINHVELGSAITAFNPVVAMQMPSLLTGDPQALALMNLQVTQQSLMISYLDDFKLMMYITLAAMPIVLLLTPAKRTRPSV